MGLGLQVDKSALDLKCAQAVLELRSALNKSESITKWLENNPVTNGVDPLIETHGYTEDEAYVIRLFFPSVDAIRTANASLIDIGRKMTGLE